MSRLQSTQAFNTASDENATDFGNAQSAFGTTENAIGNYNNQLAKFVSGNPYTQGGEYDQTINTGLTNVSDAGANSLAGALQALFPTPEFNRPNLELRAMSSALRILIQVPRGSRRSPQGSSAQLRSADNCHGCAGGDVADYRRADLLLRLSSYISWSA